MIGFFEWLDASNGKLDPKEFLQQWAEYTATLEAIAADPAVSSKERATAQKILEELAATARAHTADAIRTLVEIAGDEGSIDPDAQADAKRALADITERLPPASDKVQ